MQKVKLLVTKYRYWVVYAVVIGIYLCLTLPALLDRDHVFLNLEPYPDSIYYVGSAKQMVENHAYNLQYSDGDVLKNGQPPLYSAYLAVFFLFSSSLWTVYVANLILGLLSFTTLFLLLKKLTKNYLATLFGALAYCSFFFVYLLPSLPMTESLSLFLFTLVTYLLILGNGSWQWFVAGGVAIVALMFSRFATMTTGLTAGVLLFTHQLTLTSKNRKPLLVGITILVVLLTWVTLGLLGISPANLASTLNEQLRDPTSVYFSFRYVLPNFLL